MRRLLPSADRSKEALIYFIFRPDKRLRVAGSAIVNLIDAFLRESLIESNF
jgi:hypothetical protein